MEKRRRDRRPEEPRRPPERAAAAGGKTRAPESKPRREGEGKPRREADAKPRREAEERTPRPPIEAVAEAGRASRPPVRVHADARPAERLPVILTVEPDEDYALLDSGAGEKLERYGPLVIRRPENQAVWRPRLSPAEWERADAVFTGDTDEEGLGRWRFPGPPLGETWPMAHRGLSYLGRFTSYRHVGVFPEQAPHWQATVEAVEAAGPGARVLNLFGYTGLASLLAARAGAEVTHVDASKKAIAWARENAEAAGLSDRPVRWICEDAVRYAEREARRGSRYDVVLLDPPRFGRGPKGEVWELFEDLPYLLDLTRELLSPRPRLVILTAYSIRASFFSLSALTGEAFRGMGGTVESGELVIREAGEDARRLSTSLFSRWTPT